MALLAATSVAVGCGTGSASARRGSPSPTAGQAPATQAPATQAPATQAPATQAPATQAPATQAPATQAPATQAPATQAPATQAPATQAPATQAPATQTPAVSLGDGSAGRGSDSGPSVDAPFGNSFVLGPLPDPLPGRPAWLGKRALPLRSDGYGAVLPTPAELEDRAFPTIDLLAAPVTPDFYADIRPVPPDVVARASWRDGCPVALEDLRYVRISHWGFEGGVHTGELIVHRRVAEQIVGVFRELFDAHFPIEALRVADMGDLDAPPTGDGNGSGSFVCRAARTSTRWSDHALGTAIDINPFQNPFHKGDLALPELASSYLDRSRVRPGMITPQGPVVAAFRRIGWGWGGSWRSSKDFMHFSESGR